MAKANHKTTISAPAHLVVLDRPTYLDPTTFPRFYGMTLSGDCMEPDFTDGEVLVFDKEGVLRAGTDAIFFFRPELLHPGQLQCAMKRLVTAVPDFVTFPWKDNPKSEVVPVIIAEQLNPRKRYVIHCDKLLAVHRCIGRKSELETRRQVEAEGWHL